MLAVVRVDVPDQLAQLRIAEVRELAELAMAEGPTGDRANLSAPLWKQRPRLPAEAR